jgi:hypothetical protein
MTEIAYYLALSSMMAATHTLKAKKDEGAPVHDTEPTQLRGGHTIPRVDLRFG